MPHLNRRRFLTLSLGTAAVSRLRAQQTLTAQQPLRSPHYNQVTLLSEPHLAQQRNAQTILAGLSDDSLLKPFRAMSGKPGQPAPGIDIGGWYTYLPTYDFRHGDAGFAPGHAFGQWTSALARLSAAQRDSRLAARVRGLHAQLAESISPAFFDQTRFPAYTFDKLICGLVDAHALLDDPAAFPTLDRVRDAALPSLPGRAIEREAPWRPNRDVSFHWDESYILPENLYRAASLGAGPVYLQLARDYRLDSFFLPLSRNENVLGGLHAYSHINALCSAMQAWFVEASQPHLLAAINAFRMLEAQSFATGGWGPDELLEAPGSDRLYTSLTRSHNSFETPCGAFAHTKLTRYLLQATRDGHYGDSMERVLLNTALGARPMQGDGRSFYNADFSAAARRVDSPHRWPCCSGTLPQLAADHGINAYLLGPTTPHEPASVWVNLYLSSVLRWTEHTTHLQIEQQTAYPEQDTVRLRLTASRPITFSLHLRIPEWSQKPTQNPSQNPAITINGQPQPLHIPQGFAELRRRWRTGDQIDLHLPMSLRLEPLQTNGGMPHPEIVSLLYGPSVLMPLCPMPSLTRAQLLSARRSSPTEWTVQTSDETIPFRPFPHVGDSTYSAHIYLL